ncbi:acyl-CoA N-acyltransferase [Gymnopus androsaceus JB14]|uniref:Acyl-CoA N-acyltransferase n=1 Tax=Gymnopus androsaceus JB14 TaxID=1447944 RepID=A0A6A4I051_9AGAR|nr:acyl-CoA N-acyltransferase [Gymnopus androsaceus JB14]
MAVNVIFNLVNTNQLENAIRLELEGYPTDEAASLESFRLRQFLAGELFLGAFRPGSSSPELVGFICGTRASGSTLTHESMSQHTPDGPSVCIHSVCVSASYRRQGIALGLLKEYFSRVLRCQPKVERILLIAHEELIPLYVKAGFELVGKSSVAHGARPWYEMCLVLPPMPFEEVDPLISGGDVCSVEHLPVEY